MGLKLITHNDVIYKTNLYVTLSKNHNRNRLHTIINMPQSLQDSDKSYTFALAKKLFDVMKCRT